MLCFILLEHPACGNDVFDFGATGPVQVLFLFAHLKTLFLKTLVFYSFYYIKLTNQYIVSY